MNFVKYFCMGDYRNSEGFLSPELLCDAVNAFAKENGCEPISVAVIQSNFFVTFHPIDYSTQEGKKE